MPISKVIVRWLEGFVPTDAVMGVAKGYGWPELSNYAVSLAKCGFQGEKILFIDQFRSRPKEPSSAWFHPRRLQ